MKKKGSLIGSTFVKIVMFFLLVISFLAGVAGVMGTLILGEWGGYRKTFEDFAWEAMQSEAISDYSGIVNLEPNFLLNIEENLDSYCRGTNLSAEVYLEKTEIFSNHTEKGTYQPYQYSFWITMHMVFDEEGRPGWEQGYLQGSSNNRDYELRLYVDPEFPEEDGYAVLFREAKALYGMRNVLPIMGIAGILFFFICFVFLMCSAGHKNGREGITPSPFYVLHLDFLTVVWLFVAGGGILVGSSFISGLFSLVVMILIFGAGEIILGTLFCMEVMIRLKLGRWWRHTVCYVVLRWALKLFRGIGRGIVLVIQGIPFIINTLIVFFGICILECIGLLFYGSAELAVLWILEKAILFPVVVYFAMVCRKLQNSSEALAKGNLSYQVDTSRMILDFKKHGENLNQIGHGMNVAVEQRMKSEHLKTELITNVSHDLKTPLTSIINYADLIGAEATENEKIKEYAQVLLRQSGRLKKLLDDLVEASKATTGNLEVELQPCEVGVLLTQAVGEYEQRFLEKQLELITRQPEGQVRVLADGRHLWRVFDNLLNNICKYAQEGSRVYLTVEQKEGRVEIIFRNMSKYALDISGEELQERFVRGDKSRHMEGNGLGLSIAKSLVDLQNGEMEIITDGDLFKVVLRFEILEDRK